MVSFAPNLRWVDYPVVERLSKALGGVAVVADNDGNCAGRGEASYGAGVGYRHLVCVTVGTGIGCAVIIDGRVYHGFNDAAGEVGHMVIVRGGAECLCGNSGCLESVASGTAIARRGRQPLVRQQAPHLSAMAGGHPDQVTAALVMAAADRGDMACRMVLDDAARYLAIGLANLAQVLNPEAIILGGGVMLPGDGLLTQIEERLRVQLLGAQRDKLVVKRAALGSHSGLWGALELVKDHVGGRERTSSPLL